jgi:hypothetical protein
MSKKQSESKTVKPQDNSSIVGSQGPLVFISHDTRDADLAEAFANLLTDASGGMLKSFRSSDRKGTAGIEFGQEWYKAIMGNLSKATDVVALLTHHSIDRPWILYEAGVAKGTLNTTVLGAAIGIPFEKTNTGPFAQFQNCGDDEDSLTKLVLQLIRRIPDAAPREEAVRRQVQAFRESMTSLLKSRGKAVEAAPKVDEATIAKMFEEVKVLVRDLPDRVQGQIQSKPGSRRRRNIKFHPMMLEDMTERLMHRKEGGRGIELLIMFSFFREDFPWLYELGLNLYQALQKDNEREVEKAFHALRAVIEMTSKDPIFFEMSGGPDDEDSFMFLRHMSHTLEHTLERTMRRWSHNRKSSKPGHEDEVPKAG